MLELECHWNFAILLAQSCGNIGSSSTSSYIPLTTSAFYLNIEDRTTCSGYVSELTLSFYNVPSGPNPTPLVVYVAFYQPQSPKKNVFVKVTDEVQVLITQFPSVVENNGLLKSVVFPLSQALLVEEETVLGVCIPGNDTTQTMQPLQIVSSGVVNVTNNRLLVGSCDQNRLPTEVGLDNFQNLFGVLLHVHASTGKK